MKLQEIKQAILDKSIDDNLIVFVCDENFFIVDQYIEAISSIKNAGIQYIDSLDEINSAASLVTDTGDTLYVLKTETFAEVKENYSNLDNVIIVCKKLDKKVEAPLKDFIVKVPKLEEWQVVAYIKSICPEVSDTDCALFYKASGKDIYKVANEIDKVQFFEKTEQKEVFMELLFGDNSDMYTTDNLTLANRIVENNKAKVYEILARRKYLDLDPFPIIALVLNTFKNIVLVNHQSGITDFSDFGMSPKQVNFYKNNYRGYSLDFLMNNIRFLSGLDEKLKLGLLDMPKDQFFDYVICHVMR